METCSSSVSFSTVVDDVIVHRMKWPFSERRTSISYGAIQCYIDLFASLSTYTMLFAFRSFAYDI